ncbi:hypothetical protein KO527_12270 [Pseudoalteromonas sp. C2R02]|uniref:hypothetical protein n=1 Tax=Pseudoalteromonas sp. C2R02 TaxID=2841565 RepID=UPI001C092923|nr:hypothetical protein [Pseudoalteromonas sp. C2R02]MBU2970125.1 hypothetical protein [Pseudoalteromonas sp. C2R02]
MKKQKAITKKVSIGEQAQKFVANRATESEGKEYGKNLNLSVHFADLAMVHALPTLDCTQWQFILKAYSANLASHDKPYADVAKDLMEHVGANELDELAPQHREIVEIALQFNQLEQWLVIDMATLFWNGDWGMGNQTLSEIIQSIQQSLVIKPPKTPKI